MTEILSQFLIVELKKFSNYSHLHKKNFRLAEVFLEFRRIKYYFLVSAAGL